MDTLASLLVGKPLNILVGALPFFVGYLTLRFTSLGVGRHPRPLLLAATGWVLYASWEWLIRIRTPEANIRVDLLVIWPVLAILSLWALFRVLR